MTSPGAELARARQRLGLSLADVSRRTTISVERLTAIEQADAARMPDKVHLRGYVCAFAKAVGLDPQAASARFIAELNDWSPLDEFESEVDPPSLPDNVLSFPSGAPREAKSRRPPRLLPVRRASVPRAREATLLISTLTVAVTAAVWPFAARRQAGEQPLVKPTPVASTEGRRDSVDVKDPNPIASFTASGEGVIRADLSAIQEADELDGWWLLTNQIEQSSTAAFNDLTLGFRLQLEQEGNRVRGQGFKWMENGKPISSGARTPITVDGTVEADRVALRFTERGTRRTSRGNFAMRVGEDGSLRGRFASDAARSSGRAQAIRISTSDARQ